jgi:hypothetical protein
MFFAFADIRCQSTTAVTPQVTTLTPRSSGTTHSLTSIVYANNEFVAVGDSGTILTSLDGLTWTIRNSNALCDLTSVTYGNGQFMAIGNSGLVATGICFLISPDGVIWTTHTLEPFTYWITSVAYGSGKFVVVGGGGTILTSSDAITWTRQNSTVNDWLNSVTYGNNQFVTVGDSGAIITSPDATIWTLRNWSTTIFLHSVIYGDGRFLTMGPTAGVLTSSNGTTWNTQNFGGIFFEPDFGIYGGNQFVAMNGSGGTFFTSSDASSWTENNMRTPPDYLYAIAYGNSEFVVVGYIGAIMTFKL